MLTIRSLDVDVASITGSQWLKAGLGKVLEVMANFSPLDHGCLWHIKDPGDNSVRKSMCQPVDHQEDLHILHPAMGLFPPEKDHQCLNRWPTQAVVKSHVFRYI